MCFISIIHLHSIQLWTTSTMITKPIQSNHSKRLPSNYATTANPSNVIQANAFKLRLHIHAITLKCTTVTQSNQKPTKHGNHGTPCKSYTQTPAQTQHAMNTRDQGDGRDLPDETKHSDIPLNKICSKIVLTQQST